MTPNVTLPRGWYDRQIHMDPDTEELHWRNYHMLRHMERRLIALGRDDIVADAEKYAEERMKHK